MSSIELTGWTGDTICAVSTPPGRGGIAVIRVSGPQALDIVQRRWQGKPLADMATHTVHLGQLTDAAGEMLDQAVLTVYRAPNSFTGEDVAELACHGSTWIQQQVIQTLIDAGCRHATAGEFTRRAFANGRMDLSQAEAVADVIEAQSRAAHHVAMSQMRGRYSDELRGLRDKLLHFVALIELELDFSEEDVTFADRGEVTALAHDIHSLISRLADSYRDGNAIRNGMPVAIIGQTNAGKSTLLNALLRDDRALVSDIHGTTRDTIEDTIDIQGVTFRFIDTAGIRQTTDQIEQIGIERTYAAINKARIILWMIDTEPSPSELQEMQERCKDKSLIIIQNKIDKEETTPEHSSHLSPLTSQTSNLKSQTSNLLRISAKFGTNISEVEQAIFQAANIPAINSSDVIVNNARHYEVLTRANEHLQRVLDGLQQQLSGDLLSEDLRLTLNTLAEITGGQITPNEVLGNIFKHFCVGK